MTYDVSFGDIEDYYKREEWAQENCKSFINLKFEDFSDFSFGKHDLVITYIFGDEADAIMFKLRWS